MKTEQKLPRGARRRKKSPYPDQETIRDLVLAVEFMRHVCEHTTGATVKDRDRLIKGMNVGIVISHRHGTYLEDYQHDPFWKDVFDLPNTLGVTQ